jgi:hypothetical protein
MSKEKKSNLRKLAKIFGLSMSTVQAIGERALFAQLGDRAGGNDTRCDDCNATGYTGDLAKDYEGLLNSPPNKDTYSGE